MEKSNEMDLNRIRSRGLYIKIVQDRDMFRDSVLRYHILLCAHHRTVYRNKISIGIEDNYKKIFERANRQKQMKQK